MSTTSNTTLLASTRLSSRSYARPPACARARACRRAVNSLRSANDTQKQPGAGNGCARGRCRWRKGSECHGKPQKKATTPCGMPPRSRMLARAQRNNTHTPGVTRHQNEGQVWGLGKVVVVVVGNKRHAGAHPVLSSSQKVQKNSR